jgi:hypothetical protein
MRRALRVLVATLSGVLCGFICFGLASAGPGELPWPVAVQIVTDRTLIGVAIGISSLRLGHWSIHGLVMGMLFSVPLAFSGLMAPDSPDYNKNMVLVFTIVLGMTYGLLIELITSVVFRLRSQ